MGKIALFATPAMQEQVFGEKYYQRLEKAGTLFRYDRTEFTDRAHVVDFVKDAKIIITSWGSPVIGQEILDVCPDLRLLAHAAGSIKPVISEEFIKKGIPAINAAAALGEGVAETALAFAISACKGFFRLSGDTKNGLWAENRLTAVKDFYDITVGVISGGFVGRHMVKLLQNFHVDIVMYDPTLNAEQIEKIGAKKVSLEELLEISDVITIHAPQIPATDNMLHKENLKRIRDGAVLINTARGTVINEADLIEEMKTGRFTACIDVTNPEPPSKENALRSLDNVVLTPHIAGAVTNGMKRVALLICEEVERLLGGQPLLAKVELSELSILA